MAVGNSLVLSERINGLRLVDTATKNQYRCRVEIWVDFRDSEENLEILKEHAKELEDYFNETGISVKQIRFFNIDSDTKAKTVNQINTTPENGTSESNGVSDLKNGNS